jgi:methionyl-tRNA formyltransferase
MLAFARVPVDDKTAGELTAELAEIGAQLMVGTLIDLPMLHPLQQDDAKATYAPKIDKAEAKIDWSGDAEGIERQVRGLAPFPGAWFELDGERIKVLKAQAVPREGKPGFTLDENLTIACGFASLRP